MKNLIDVALPILDYDNTSPFDVFVKEDLQNRILVLNQSITEEIIDEHVMCILRWNAQDKDIPVEKRKPIVLYINSKGGNSFDGQALIDVILASKTKVKTVCLGMAASMAYLIFLAGHERYSFPNACLLMYEGAQEISNSASKTRDIMEFFDEVDERIKQFILSRTKIDSDFYDGVYKKELWMYADSQGKEFGIVHKIIGQDCDLDELF